MEDRSSLGTKAGNVSEYRDNQSSISLKSIDYSTSKIEMNKSPDMRYVYAMESAEFTILARRLDRKRDEWQRLPSCQELEADLGNRYSVCCPKKDSLFVFCCMKWHPQELNQIYTLRMERERRYSWRELTLSFSLFDNSVRFNTLLLPHSGRIGVTAFGEINTSLQLTKEERAFPVGRQIVGRAP